MTPYDRLVDFSNVLTYISAGNGLLDYDEFLAMMRSRSSPSDSAAGVDRGAPPRGGRSPETELRALFTAFDKDGNGYIDGTELRDTMKDVGLELTEHDIDDMMAVAGVAIKDRIFYEGRSEWRGVA